jgi:type I restriction enzyme S subunit
MKFVKLGDHINLVGGGTPSKDVDSYWNGDIPWASVKDFKSDYISSTVDTITEEGVKNSATRIIPAGTLLIATRMAVGKVAFAQMDVAINQDLKAIICHSSLYSKFLFYLLKSKSVYFESVSSGATVQGIKINHILDIQIPLPPLATQQKIAAILDAADAYRQLTKTLIAKYDQLAQSLFLDMFGDPVRNEKGWEKVKFEELVSENCPLTYGIVQPGEETENGVPCVRPVDLTTQYVNIETLKRIDPKISSQFKRTILKGGEILLSVRGSVGVISIADLSLKGSNVTRGIVPIWFDEIISNKLFFFYLYKTDRIQNQIKGLAKGATLIQINLSDLRSIELIKPPIALQNQFAERIQLLEAQKQQAQASLQKAEELFNSLLYRCFDSAQQPVTAP